MKKKLSTILIVLLFLISLSLLTYPYIANQWNVYRNERLISKYYKEVSTQEEDYSKYWQTAQEYNRSLVQNSLTDSFNANTTTLQDDTYNSCLNLLNDGVMGYIDIPKIGVTIPIYHTTQEEVLQKGVGHLQGSSLPVGGEGTHSVLAGHRGLPNYALFTDLDLLQVGDCFTLHILDGILCYQVDQIVVVEPQDTSNLAIVKGMDYVTLLTCTPYGVNTHRLLVRGHRIPYTSEVENKITDNAIGSVSLYTNYLFWIVLGITITIVFAIVLTTLERKRNKR